MSRGGNGSYVNDPRDASPGWHPNGGPDDEAYWDGRAWVAVRHWNVETGWHVRSLVTLESPARLPTPRFVPRAPQRPDATASGATNVRLGWARRHLIELAAVVLLFPIFVGVNSLSSTTASGAGLSAVQAVAPLAQLRPTGFLERARRRGTVQQGINFAGWSTDAFSTPSAASSLRALAATGATWVSVVVEQFQDSVDSTSIFPTKQTVSDAGLTSIIEQAHALHLNVALKPQVNVLTGAFRGTIGTTFTPAQWTAWFASYRTFIAHYATLAQHLGVQQFVVGTELTEASLHAGEWKSMVSTVRSQFSGSLTYAANFDSEVQAITWWNKLNYIGVDAYYALDTSQPDYGWAPYVAQLSALAKRWGKPILLTEIGYRSVVGATSQPWNFSLTGPVDTAVQAGAYAAAFEAFAHQPWFAGMYWWAWSPQIPNGPSDNGYSPQNKPAEQQLKSWYGGKKS